MRDQRLCLTSEELKAVELALHSFVINTCENPEKATDAQMEAMPHAAQVLLHYFKGSMPSCSQRASTPSRRGTEPQR